jgi:hypothetical protein
MNIEKYNYLILHLTSGRLLRFRLPSARRLPFNLSLKRSRSGVSALSSAEESPPSESASSSSSGVSSCPLAGTRGGGSSAPHRRSLPGLLEATVGTPSTPSTPVHNVNNNCSSSTADLLAATAGKWSVHYYYSVIFYLRSIWSNIFIIFNWMNIYSNNLNKTQNRFHLRIF